MIDASAPITTLDLDLDALAANVMAEWHIPGLALAVLRRDAPPLLQAFGFTDIESRTRVETATLFPIGSITKSFTATGLGLLVDEGKLGWEVPVREILAEFKLKDPVANEKCTLRDLLTHRIGLPRHDWVHTPGPLDNAGILAALRHLDPSQEFRSAFQIPEPYVSGGRHGGGAHRRATPGGLRSGPHPRPARHGGHHDLIGGDGVGAHKPRCAAYVSDVLSRMPVRPIHTRPSGSICASIADIASYFAVSSSPDRRSGRPAVVGGRCDPAHGATNVR
jgi:hypothetical protein